MCPNRILAVGCIPIGSVVILVMVHYYKFLSKHSSRFQAVVLGKLGTSILIYMDNARVSFLDDF
jgi:predicted cation transporter